MAVTEENDSAAGVDRTLDVSGLNCPLPLLKAKVELTKMQAGEVLRVIATDRHAPIDFRVYCMQAKHEIVNLIETVECCEIFLRKASSPMTGDNR
ncbi:MAG: sulfurtransferase TusA family protein [Gammaproteobacteria bacterium]